MLPDDPPRVCPSPKPWPGISDFSSYTCSLFGLRFAAFECPNLQDASPSSWATFSVHLYGRHPLPCRGASLRTPPLIVVFPDCQPCTRKLQELRFHTGRACVTISVFHVPPADLSPLPFSDYAVIWRRDPNGEPSYDWRRRAFEGSRTQEAGGIGRAEDSVTLVEVVAPVEGMRCERLNSRLEACDLPLRSSHGAPDSRQETTTIPVPFPLVGGRRIPRNAVEVLGCGR